VFAVEPEHRNLELLRANLWRQGCDNVTVLPVAAHAGRRHVSLVSHPEGLAGSWIDNGHEGATLVPSAALDELLEGNRVDVLKLDIERSEPEAIAGAERLIRAAPSLDVVTELWPGHTYAGGRSAADVLDLYESLGLELRLLRSDGSTAPATAKQVLAAGEPSPIMNIVLQKHQV
jgi:FkbM family methyltransferase